MKKNPLDLFLDKIPKILGISLIIGGIGLSWSIDNYFFVTISLIGITILFILYKNRKKEEN